MPLYLHAAFSAEPAGPLKVLSAPVIPGRTEPLSEPVHRESAGYPMAQHHPPQQPRHDLGPYPERIVPTVRTRIRPVRGGKIQAAVPMGKGALPDLPDGLMQAMAGA